MCVQVYLCMLSVCESLSKLLSLKLNCMTTLQEILHSGAVSGALTTNITLDQINLFNRETHNKFMRS